MHFKASMENRGTAWIWPHVWLDLFDEEGSKVGRFRSPRKARIYPSTSITHTIALNGVADGKYVGYLVIKDPNGEVFGAQYDLLLGE